MFIQHHSVDRGWYDSVIEPYHNINLDPSAAVLHYSQEIFEGLKAYRRNDGGINLFRAQENMKRFNRSARRVVMPEVDETFHLEALLELIRLDQAWVPHDHGASLYIRPAMIATSSKLGLGAANDYTHFIITGPARSYFAAGFNPIPVYVADEYRRAVVGGVGEAKTGGNYAASLYISEQVAKKGYSQVLWLDAIHGKYVEEVGAMNICFVYEGKQVVTPELSGSILPGITRDSILKLAPTMGYDVAEARLDINDVLKDIDSGKITEVFGCGTAAVISPVGELCYQDNKHIINNNQTGPVSKAIFDQLIGIQYGDIPDPFNWLIKVT
jgi:branched-chain amino acid aminotransferase